MSKDEFLKIDVIAEDFFAKVQNNSTSGKMVCDLESGFTDLDKATFGWKNGELILISGRPSMGKTAFMLSMIINMSVKLDIPVAVFSLEDTATQLVNKLIANYCEIDSNRVRNGLLSREEWSKLDSKLKKLIEAKIYIDCPPRLKIQDLCSKAKELVAQHGIKALYIDYVQLLTVTDNYTENRYNEINYISRELKALAKELDIPIFVISQMNRNSDTDKDRNSLIGKRPRLSDLRDSGTLCDDADIVCFIFRPEYYHLTEDAQGNSLIGIAEIILEKNRNGYATSTNLSFKQEYCKFQDLIEDNLTENNPFYYTNFMTNNRSDEVPF